MAWSRRRRWLVAALLAVPLALGTGVWWALREAPFGVTVRGAPDDPAGPRFRVKIVTELVGHWRHEGEADFRPGQTVYFGTQRNRWTLCHHVRKTCGDRAYRMADKWFFPDFASQCRAGAAALDLRQRNELWFLGPQLESIGYFNGSTAIVLVLAKPPAGDTLDLAGRDAVGEGVVPGQFLLQLSAEALVAE